MPGSSPQPLALGEPAAVLLLDAPDGAARALAGAADDELPADLDAFRREAGLAEDPAWQRVREGAVVPGALLPGGLWLVTGRVAGRGRLLVALLRAEGGAGPERDEQRPEHAGPALAAGPGMALSVVRDGRALVDWVDGGYTRTTGTAAAEVLGGLAARLVRCLGEAPDPVEDAPGAPLAAARSGLRRALGGGEPVDATVVDVRADGTRFLHQVRTTALRDRAGRVRGVLSRHADVTGRTAGEAVATGAARAAERRTERQLQVLRELDAFVVADDDVPAGLRALVRALGEHVVAAALVALTVERPAGPVAEVEVVAAHGAQLHALAGRRLRLERPPAADALLDGLLDAAGGPAALADLARRAAPGSPTAWLAALVPSPAALVLPLRGREDVVGALVVLPREDGLRDGDATVLGGAARRAGLLVENARLHAREHALAETLQRSMLPDQSGIDGIDGLDVWTFYASNADAAQVGGDWYDVLPAPEGGSAVAGVVIGDVVGHDVEAAAAMGQIRSVVRSAAHDLDDPGSVLMRVDQLAAGMRVRRMASLVYATLQRLDDGGWEMAWSSAGHLPPLLRRGRGGEGGGPQRVDVLSDATGTLVGLGERPRPTRERALGPGDVLVFYTDGLIETRSRPMRDGLEVLVELLATSRARDAAGIGEELLQGLGESPEDDTAIVVVRVPEESELAGGPLPTADTPRRRRWQLPPEPSSVGKARHATLRACAVWGLDIGPRAEIVVSELVANAVLHGWGTVGLRLFDLPGALRIEVEDDSPEEPAVVEARPDGAGGHGMRLVASLGRWGTVRTRRGKIVWVEIPAGPAGGDERSTSS
ncbi:SpoIIE family protein phosphatase [Kineococcus sp. T13]|uniref:ATP-binding SpoIIE family protein phosphatase n=1 Tax=Kineococcus vitellinus TaxID=2696565 RepID=UPI001412F36C|nr:SpoIIE family protein phosphatase [Kineococcus vitellinus]NAZ76738.1 SpoIIE family protein phosphatase [Kineococcus vitellinus]